MVTSSSSTCRFRTRSCSSSCARRALSAAREERGGGAGRAQCGGGGRTARRRAPVTRSRWNLLRRCPIPTEDSQVATSEYVHADGFTRSSRTVLSPIRSPPAAFRWNEPGALELPGAPVSRNDVEGRAMKNSPASNSRAIQGGILVYLFGPPESSASARGGTESERRSEPQRGRWEGTPPLALSPPLLALAVFEARLHIVGVGRVTKHGHGCAIPVLLPLPCVVSERRLKAETRRPPGARQAPSQRS